MAAKYFVQSITITGVQFRCSQGRNGNFLAANKVQSHNHLLSCYVKVESIRIIRASIYSCSIVNHVLCEKWVWSVMYHAKLKSCILQLSGNNCFVAIVSDRLIGVVNEY